jgi:hypothetical protein
MDHSHRAVATRGANRNSEVPTDRRHPSRAEVAVVSQDEDVILVDREYFLRLVKELEAAKRKILELQSERERLDTQLVKSYQNG